MEKKMKADGYVALITGSSRGIGKTTAVALSQYGASIAVNFLKDRLGAEAVAEEINNAGGDAIVLQADVADSGQVYLMIEEVIRQYGRLDILVNNAGEIFRPAGWQEITDPVWHRSLDVNLKGAFNCTRAAAPHLSNSDVASVINITSTFGAIIGSPAIIAYGAAKSGVVSLTRSFAKALAPKVRVNCIAPGIIDTDMTAGSPADFVQKQIELTPLKRIGKPEDIANTVLYLVSPWSRFVTGQMIVVDGGHSLR